jgi:hypothetical protein
MANRAVWQVSSGSLSLLRVLRLLRTQCTIKRTEGARLLSALVVPDAPANPWPRAAVVTWITQLRRNIKLNLRRLGR